MATVISPAPPLPNVSESTPPPVPPAAERGGRTTEPLPPPRGDGAAYWLGLPFRWAYQIAHNGHGILCVLDITRFRPLPSGLIACNHPWATGLDPNTGKPIWPENVIFRSARGPEAAGLPQDHDLVMQTGRYLAAGVAKSAVVPEIPTGPGRRMPHGINYIHGASHYNSGILIFTDFQDALGHFTDARFRAEVHRFVRLERREVLILFRQTEYRARDFAYFVCSMRTLFPWFCNANGPRGRVLWGNSAPFPAANMITGHWIRDVYALKRMGGAAVVVRPAITPRRFFQGGPYGGGRRQPLWPERLLAWATYLRVRLRGGRGGMFFVDRRKVYADQIERCRQLGLADEPIAGL
jgi:hypothetical protein